MPARRRAAKGWLSPSAVPRALPPNWNGLLTPVVAHTFEELRISVALWTSGATWYPIHVVQHVADFEYEHGIASRRWAYNFECCQRVKLENQIVCGEHLGFHDLFVPVRDAHDKVRGIFVVGPFATSRPSTSNVQERWREITGAQGHLSDPSFAHYVSTTLETLTLEGELARSFQRLMWCFARLVSGRGNPRALAVEAETLGRRLSAARAAESTWDAARYLLDERSSRTWPTHAQAALARLGLKRAPEHVAVGLLFNRQPEAEPLEALIRRDTFQRACVDLVRKHGDAVCGQLSDHGVVFLLDYPSSAARVRTKLGELVSRAAKLARSFDLELHAGLSQVTGDGPLPARYRAALWAAEKALAEGVAVVHGEPQGLRSGERLRELRSELARSVGENARLLSQRFNRYIEAVLGDSGYRLDLARIEFNAGLERLIEPLLGTGLLEPKAWSDLRSTLERESNDARTVMELVSAYRRLVADLESALKNPTASRRGRGLRRAIRFIHEHLNEPLNLEQVARVAGYAPDYFSKVFQRGEGVTFGEHLRKLRLARAKHMLVSTTLSIEQVQRLSGFQTRVHFHRAFKQALGTTPSAYRKRQPKATDLRSNARRSSVAARIR